MCGEPPRIDLNVRWSFGVPTAIGLPSVRFCGTKGDQGLIDTPPGVGGGSRILAANGQIGQFLAADVILAVQAARLSSAAKDLNRQ